MKLQKLSIAALPVLLALTGCAAMSSILPGGGNKQTIPSIPQEELVITEPEVIQPIQSTLKEGETLWEFSRRTTGSGFNWEQIAVLNSIEDEKKVDAGLVLIVPPDIALEELKNQ